MASAPIAARVAASRVARWLLEKGRREDAVAVLSAWAANGPNDPEGRDLLAEALRIDPSSALAKLACQRMDGVSGQQEPLDAAIAHWTGEELREVERHIVRPSFLRAQVGFNNNVRYKGLTFHIQTEDSGIDKPHIITHLFADGGRIIKGHKRSYAEHVTRDDVAMYVRRLMKAQQIEMALALREGKFDAIIEGQTRGGLEELSYPPKVDWQSLASRKKLHTDDGAGDEQREDETAAGEGAIEGPGVAATSPAARAALAPVAASDGGAETGDTTAGAGAGTADGTSVRPEPRPLRLDVLRSLNGGPTSYAAPGPEAVIGSAGAIRLPDERFCHPREATIRVRKGRVWLRDCESGSGVFLRIKAPTKVAPGDEVIVGDQLLRVERNPPMADGPDPGLTYFCSSPRWRSAFRVLQLFEGGAPGACVMAREAALEVGSVYGDLIFPSDPLVSERHCILEEEAGTIVLTDLNSRTGVFVRIKGEQELVHDDELLIGRTRLKVDLG